MVAGRFIPRYENKKGLRRGATLEPDGWNRFQSSLRDESDCRCQIHGMNPVTTIMASLRDVPPSSEIQKPGPTRR